MKCRPDQCRRSNEGAIAQTIIDGQTLAASNRKLARRIIIAEMEHVEPDGDLRKRTRPGVDR